MSFRNVPARVAALAERVELPGFGQVEVDVVHAGACYASVSAAALGLEATPVDLNRLIAAGRRIRAALAGHPATVDPQDERLSGVYGVIFHQDLPDDPSGALRQRNVTVFADGQVDRSPCGSGTSARLALLDARGQLAPGRELRHESLIGTAFTARALHRTSAGLVTEVTGSAHLTGFHRFVLDPRDRLGTGFVLR